MVKLLNYRCIVFLLGLVLLTSLTGCSNESENFIQGQWQRGNLHFADEWYFDRGNFEHILSLTASHPVLQTGRYRVLEVQEDGLIIELFDVTASFGDDRQDIKVAIDWENDSIRILGKDYYRTP